MNSKRFISAYNKIDKKLRNLYNIKSNSTFPDAVRRAAAYSALVRKYEDDLIDYSRLRNAIVHNSSDDMVIAEPHISVVDRIEHIDRMLSSPPRAIDTVAKKAVCFSSDVKIKKAIEAMAAANYSNVPVLKEGMIIGVINNKLIVEAIARNLDGDVNRYINEATIASALTKNTSHYVVMRDFATVDEVLSEFSANRKLQIVVLTYKGLMDGDIKGVVTTGDIIDINKILENY